jgi:hypothetical protein
MTVQALSTTDSVWSLIWRFCFQIFLAGTYAAAHAEGNQESGADLECARAEVLAHVQEQFRLYGPLSLKREYFGFVYRFNGAIQSSVTQGHVCGTNHACGVDTTPAAKGIPPGAKVLGEWHTHPRDDGSRNLSTEDVRGAYGNRRIRCYTAHYSQPDGDIHSWDINSDSVPVAMVSRVRLGNYRDHVGVPAIIAAHETPGIECLSTNTNVHTAGTTKKYCRRSTTSRSRSARPAARRG